MPTSCHSISVHLMLVCGTSKWGHKSNTLINGIRGGTSNWRRYVCWGGRIKGNEEKWEREKTHFCHQTKSSENSARSRHWLVIANKKNQFKIWTNTSLFFVFCFILLSFLHKIQFQFTNIGQLKKRRDLKLLRCLETMLQLNPNFYLHLSIR